MLCCCQRASGASSSAALVQRRGAASADGGGPRASLEMSEARPHAVVVVGCGSSGASAAWHLVAAGVRDVVVLEQGDVGLGASGGVAVAAHASLREGDLDADAAGGRFHHALASGTAVMERASCIKMSIGLYPCSSAAFVAEHGAEGARRYLRLARQGLLLQRELCTAALADPATQLQQLGSLYVCKDRAEDIAELWAEFCALRELGYEGCGWWGDAQRVRAAAGGEWARAIWFADDFVVNSTAYAAGLLDAALRRAPGALAVRTRCSPVVAVETVRGRARTTLESGEELWSEHVVLAAGGLFVDRALAGVLRPAWSYLVGITEPAARGPGLEPGGAFRFASTYSPNFFSWGFTHDWCLSGGVLRCSGEDHHSALKPPRAEERCEALAEWTAQQYPFLRPGKASCERRYGVYSETPDHSPVVGSTRPDSRVCYLQGCNAWGQASLSYAASLVPGLLGYAELTPQQRDSLKVLTVRRFALLPELGKL